MFVQDTAVYDAQGLLHGDIDTITGGFNSSHLDPVGYQGESGNYTDLETLHTASGLYTALSGPGGIYYNPQTGVGMARSRSGALNEYSDELNDLEPALHTAVVGVTGLVTGPVGAGLIDGEITYIETGNVKSAVIQGGSTAVVGLALGKAGGVIGGQLSRVIASRVAPKVAQIIAKVVRRGDNCFVAGTLVQMADNSTKPIEQVQVGDFVKSRNPKTGLTEAKRVDRTYVRTAPQVVTLSFADSLTHQVVDTFTCTPEHPFFVDGKGFVQAGDLGIGTSIVTRAGPCEALTAAAWSALPVSGTALLLGSDKTAGYRVYNLRVEDDHSYFVGTHEGGTCVHNADYPAINLEHIFHGEINASGRAVGFHHEGSIGNFGKARITAITDAPNAQGVYRGSVEIFDKTRGTWVAKGPLSSFFPKSWSRSKVLEEIRGAYKNKHLIDGKRWEGISPSGVRIGGYLDNSGGIME